MKYSMQTPYLPDVAMTLNSVANLYRATERMQKAQEAYGEASRSAASSPKPIQTLGLGCFLSFL
jgi:hypothetical protein